MNTEARAYLAQHGIWVQMDDGTQEFSLPLDKLQGFLDLLHPGDVPPEQVQHLYQMQADLVKHIHQHFERGSTETK